MKYLLDTNAVIYLLRGPREQAPPEGDYGFSVITEIELLSWPNLSPAEEHIHRQFLAGMTRCGIDDAVRETCITLRREQRLKLPDAVIAATAIVHGATLITDDQRLHAVPGLPWISLQPSTPKQS